MDAEVIGNRIYLTPPKGILHELKDTIISKFNGGGFRYIDKLDIPTEFPFEVEVVVDDDCGVCPTAIEITAEVVAKYENITARIYNITYTKPPFEPINATPAFRINKKVLFYGIPMDPKGLKNYLSSFFKEAYLLSHPKLDWLVGRIKEFAEKHGYKRNPNLIAYKNLLYKLLRNIDTYGYPYCPCRPLRKVEGTTSDDLYNMNKDRVCPCPYAHNDIRTMGHCLCGLFWSKEKVEEYIKGRLEKYGWLIKEIENIQKALEELKKAVIAGGGRSLSESILNKIHEISLYLPD